MGKKVCYAASMVAVLILAGCGSPEAQKSGSGGGKDGKAPAASKKFTIKGSDTMVILAQQWSEAYKKVNPGVDIEINGGGSGLGITSLIKGEIDICTASRPMKDKEKADAKAKQGKDPTETPVALDGLAIFVHTSNSVKELSLAQLESIYLGKTKDWKDVGGTPGKIICYGRDTSSGTHEYFKEHVLKKADFATEVQALQGSAAVINAVSKDPNAIGYSGIAYAAGVKSVPVSDKGKAIPPSLETVVSGDYPISRKLFLYTLGEPAGEVKKFIDWTLSEEGQNVCAQVGYFPLPKKK